ncbi:MAG: hypothetical protein EAZ43_11475 [Betaproteobacteria bacterium]|nr:MAG: hypothetical protein EAZ43_11475 [Betaproteobacteria bacterium]
MQCISFAPQVKVRLDAYLSDEARSQKSAAIGVKSARICVKEKTSRGCLRLFYGVNNRNELIA